ncbi:hypothetical protein SAMN05443999_10872 [Roseovarius azorensis]|uniref:Uncharacterized protein n=1 Tax=Roseovarius azorensis TaxID=1287727 RepID=A0A1H7T6W6_9RHOB|nr:hypothetical protein [Roseovarius azorensis]SEL80255.1 hypothetical protein SAMN05443999_10872 [Roseovarius azorensis]
MSRLLILGLILMPWLAVMATAGAWPRDKGQVFAVLSGQIEGPDEFGFYRQSNALYAEYGVTGRLTLGVDLGGDALRMNKTIAFLRWPLGRVDRSLKLAFELGAGQVEEKNALRPGLSLGRGFMLGGRQGWLAVDGRAVLFGGRDVALESDITFGLSASRKTRMILQLQSGRPDTGDPYARFAPSLIYETKPGQQVELGVITPIAGGGDNGIRLGLWRRF